MMSSEDDSGIGSSPLKRVKLRATINSDSESEPTPGCSNWRDETTAEVVKKNVYRRIQFHERDTDTDTDSEEELESERDPASKQKLRRSSRLNNTTHGSDEDEGEDEVLARRSQRNRISGEKEKRLRSLSKLSAKRAGQNKKLSDGFDDVEQIRENVENSDVSSSEESDESDNDEQIIENVENSDFSSSEEDTYPGYDVVVEPMVSRYQGLCRLTSCSNRFVKHVTEIIGVYFEHDPDQEKPAWICAKHEYPDYSEDIANKNAILDDLERTQSDDDFIDDPDEGDINDDNSQSDENDTMDEITQHLRKETPKDLKNADQYLNQLGKYQLEVHSWKNKSLYTSEETRYRRNIRYAKFDEGMKDGSERYDPNLEIKLLRTSKKRRKKKRSKR